MARDPVSIADTHLLNWHALPTDQDDNVPGPVWKVLTTDRASGAMTYLIHLPPGWRDDVLDWHPHTEEGFLLAGGRHFQSTGSFDLGFYLYRQPGWLHGPAIGPPYDGVTILQRTSAPLRILRYRGTKYPHVDAQPVTDEHRDWPIDQVFVNSNTLPWEDAPPGGWAGTRLKWLHRNKLNGGGAVLMDIPAGWEGSGSAARGPLEEFVAEGSLEAGGERYVKWGYACRAAGVPAGAYGSAEGARVICWWDEGPEFG